METEFFMKKLEEEKAKLESEMSSIGRRNPLDPNTWEPIALDVNEESDPVDQADIIATRENTDAVLADLEARYNSVLNALTKMKEHRYGMCEICGKEIEVDRLSADPAANTCISHL